MRIFRIQVRRLEITVFTHEAEFARLPVPNADASRRPVTEPSTEIVHIDEAFMHEVFSR